MTKKFSGKYCLEHDGSQMYCIPIELKERFNQILESLADLRYTSVPEETLEDDMFSYIFEKYKLNKHFSDYCFDNFQEIK